MDIVSSRLVPVNEQAEGALEDFKKPARLDEIGQKGRRACRHRGLVRRRGPHRPKEQDHPPLGAKRGTRPSAPTDQRTASAYIFGAICPKHGKGAALRNTEAMNLHLAEIATQIAPGAHAALVDQAGWHLSGRLVMPPNITLIPLPANNRAQSAGKRLAVPARQLALKSNLQIRDDVVNHCCEAWNKLVDQPWRIMSIGLRNWAHGS